MNAALAIARRDLIRWFTNPTGYVFIFVFIALCGFAQFIWDDQFFLDNLANLSPLNSAFPYILLFFAPAIAMGTWADERRHGTDELLLTLPLGDSTLVAGKYLAALGIYAASLAFALSFIIVLSFIGRPDVGLMFGTYLGYLLLGAGLIAIAMIGSLLVESVTVGFILGAVFCAIPVLLGDAASLVGDPVASVGVRNAFRDFSVGVVSFEAVVYFAGLAAVGLAVNLYLIRMKRMRRGRWHLPVRLACLIASFIGLAVLADRSGSRIDVTAEKLHSLTPQTRDAIKAITSEKPVFIQAYVSPDVPRNYVETRENLLGLLREIAATGQGRIHVRVSETTEASDAAREAEDRFKIRPVTLLESEGRGPEMEVYLGVAVTCGLDEVVVPFIYKSASPEYEVTRSIRAVMNAKRAKLGILSTDAKLFGGFDFQSMRPSPSWELVDELKRLYEVVTVSAEAPITESMDVLIVPMASSLPQAQLDNLFAYAKQGKPMLIFDDPFTAFDGGALGANEMKGGRQAMMGGAPPEPKGNFREFYSKIGLSWNPSDVVWDTYKPNPKRRDLDPEIVFVGKHNGASEPFSQKSKVTAKLQEVAFIFGGAIKPGDMKGIEVTPLVHAGRPSGIVSYTDLWGNSFLGGRQLNPDRPHVPSAMIEEPCLAVRAQGKDGDVAVDAIVVADLDVASPLFFRIRREEWDEFETLENVDFVLNCVDALARDEAMIELRSHRPRHRTIETVEAVRRTAKKKELEETRAEEEKAKKTLATAQSQFDDAVQKIRAREDLDVKTKEIMATAVHESEQRKFDVQKRKIEDDKKAAIRKSKQEANLQVKSIEMRIKVMALVLPPVPALLIGILVLILRIRRELEARR